MIARSRAIPLSHHTQQRLLEILPGALTWFALLVPVVAAFAIRLNDPGMLWILGVGRVLLDAYWLVRTTVTVRGVRKTLKALTATEAVDWWQRCEEFEAARPDGAPAPSEVVQCALIPTYTESYEVLHATVAALAAQNYPEHLRVCAIITRETDTGGIENVARLRDGVRGVVSIVPAHQGPVAPRNRGRQVGCNGIRRPGAQGRVRRAGSRSFSNHGDRPRFRLPAASAVLRVHHAPVLHGRRSTCVDLATRSRISQQHLASSHRCARDGDSRDSVADVPAPAPAPPGHVLLVLDVARPARRRRILGLGRDPRGLAILLEGLLPLRRQAEHAARVPTRVRRRTARTQLHRDAHIAVQPDQAVGVGSDRYPLRHLTNAAVTRRSRGGCARAGFRISSSTI